VTGVLIARRWPDGRQGGWREIDAAAPNFSRAFVDKNGFCYVTDLSDGLHIVDYKG